MSGYANLYLHVDTIKRIERHTREYESMDECINRVLDAWDGTLYHRKNVSFK